MAINQPAEIDRRAFLTGHWRSKVNIGSTCLNNKGVYCQACKDVCDEAAIIFKPFQQGIQLPMIVSESCTSCKDCVDVCPANAIAINSTAINLI